MNKAAAVPAAAMNTASFTKKAAVITRPTISSW